MATTRVLTTQRILVFTKLVLLSYIVLALVYPMDCVSSALDSTAVKLILLVSIVGIAQHDVGLSILLTLVLLTAIVRNKSPLPMLPPKVPVPVQLIESDSESETEELEKEIEKIDVSEAFELNQSGVVEEEEVIDPFNVTDDDIVVMDETIDKLTNVPEERLKAAQTNVVDPSIEDEEEF